MNNNIDPSKLTNARDPSNLFMVPLYKYEAGVVSTDWNRPDSDDCGFAGIEAARRCVVASEMVEGFNALFTAL
jgi:hypothetical protein